MRRRETGTGRQSARDTDQTALDTDQTALDTDQTALDTDQILSDADQGASDTDLAVADSDLTAADRDQVAATADQNASDRDQRASDRDLDGAHPVDAARWRTHEVSQADREASTAQRAASAVLRAQAAAERLDAADRRDEASRLRDLAAEARDRAAEARDRLAAEEDPVGPGAAVRERAMADRAQAAADRERAARDREQAALDRQQVRAALSQAQLDELTGTYRRGMGTLALQREINRARHSGGKLVLAFVDVDGLKQVNDRDGHAAGDALLIHVAATIRSKLRSYDPLVRFGGDEFVCAFADFDTAGARRRFDDIQAALEETGEGCSISVGFAELQNGDSLDDLTARGDAGLYEVKRLKQGGSANGRPRPTRAGGRGAGPLQRLGLRRSP